MACVLTAMEVERVIVHVRNGIDSFSFSFSVGWSESKGKGKGKHLSPRHEDTWDVDV
jgi:hypothetical protein